MVGSQIIAKKIDVVILFVGNNHLGGKDFTNQFQKFLLRDIHKQYQHSLIDLGDLQLLRSALESAKHDLNSHNSTVITIILTSFDNLLVFSPLVPQLTLVCVLICDLWFSIYF